ncbi:chromosome segregation ATPase [Natronospira proteinivora]|uniref:Chromosome segregation ATPase n=1 Tax=Natronospira proteinivora TaxID=1807133 RepID=A0ABT1G968_9GAMM|nr:DUF4124 domain-containing protein [Natronospira proteinivora]MCP1727858.1 chromosome segregation ATPase [Natronospira proteinivora]
MRQFSVIIAVAALVAALPLSASGQAYSWTDEDGNVHYGDSIPPEYRDQEQRTLRDGLEIERTDRALTEEEREELRHQEELAAEADRVAQLQAERDRRLLSLYASVGEIERVRDDRVDGLRSQVRLTASNLESLEDDLESVESRLDNYEGRDEDPPEYLEERYENLANQIVDRQQQLMDLEEQLQQVRDRFENDIERFTELQAEGR